MDYSVQDMNQRFEAFHEEALEQFGSAHYDEALSTWKEAYALCVGRPIQENNVLNWMAESAIRLQAYEEAEGYLREIVEKKALQGLDVPNGTLARLSVLNQLVTGRRQAVPARTAGAPHKNASLVRKGSKAKAKRKR